MSSLDEPDTYAFAWVPAPFLPSSALGAGVQRVVAALRPGGWLMLGHGKYGGSAIDDAVGRFKTIAYGGTALDDGEAEQMLSAAGLARGQGHPHPARQPGHHRRTQTPATVTPDQCATNDEPTRPRYGPRTSHTTSAKVHCQCRTPNPVTASPPDRSQPNASTIPPSAA